LILLVALGLRLYRLTGQSLWYDEGVSAFMTHRTFAEIAAATSVDIHPPLYYWLLSVWATAFGNGEIALRSYSVLLGTATVWGTWRLGRLLGGSAVGLAAAAFLAVSPLAVQYSQEVRMYAQAGLLAVASSWAGLALLCALATDDASSAPTPRRNGVLAVTYGLLTAALLYTHYYGVLVVVAQQLYAGLLLLLTRRWRRVPFWALGSGLAALLYVPWLPLALRQTGYYPGLGSPQSSWALLLDAINVLSLGVATTRFAFRAGLAPFLLLAGLGVATLQTSSVRSQKSGEVPRRLPLPIAVVSGVRGTKPGSEKALRAFILLWLILPIAGIIILSRTRPLYEPRFLMLVLPAWTILLGAGLVALARLTAGRLTRPSFVPSSARAILLASLGVGLAGLLLVPTVRSLTSYYVDPIYARDDYRGLAQTIMLREQPHDAVVLTAPGQVEIFGYYFRGSADLFPLPAQRPIDPADTQARLDALARDHDRVWLVRWAANEADPDDLILHWLDAHGEQAGTQRFGRVELRLYDLGATAQSRTLQAERGPAG
jgi:uncharacterized membrane protein